MAWIESHQSLSRHRKTLEVVAALHVDRHKLIGHLHQLWWWGLDNADTEGKLGPVTSQALADAAEWSGRDAAKFVDALVHAGFLDRLEEGHYVLHDWFDYAGKLNEQRALRRESNRQAQQRRRQRRSAPGHHRVSADNDDSQQPVSADFHDSQQPTGPTRTGPNPPGPVPPPVPPPGVTADVVLTETCPECDMPVNRTGEGHGLSRLPGRIRNCSLDHVAPYDWPQAVSV